MRGQREIRLTASNATASMNLRSQMVQNGCQLPEVLMCWRRPSLVLKYLFSHWGQTGIGCWRLL